MTDTAPGFHDKGPSLGDLVSSSTVWEEAVVPIGSALRVLVAACSVAVLLTAIATGVVLEPEMADTEFDWQLFGTVDWTRSLLAAADSLAPAYAGLSVLAGGLAVLTEGFGIAGPRVQIGIAVFAGACALSLAPIVAIVLVAAGNAALYVAGVVLAIAIVVGMIFVFFDSL